MGVYRIFKDERKRDVEARVVSKVTTCRHGSEKLYGVWGVKDDGEKIINYIPKEEWDKIRLG